MIFKVNKTKDYTVISNYHLRDERLTLKAKGLLSLMLSLPDNWDYSIAGLAAINKEGEHAVETALQELKKAGYLVIVKLLPDQTKSKRLEYVYNIYEQPYGVYLKQAVNNQGGSFQGVEVQGVEVQGLEIQGVENRRQINIDKQNIDKQNKDISNIENRTESQKRFIAPTVATVKAYCDYRGNKVDPQRFVDYYTANGWKKDWKASVRTWERKGFDAGKTETTPETQPDDYEPPVFTDGMSKQDRRRAKVAERGMK